MRASTPMTMREAIARIPLWTRVGAVIAVVLVGVVLSSMLLDTSGVGEHESGGDTEMGDMEMNGGGHGSRDSCDNGPGTGDGGGHGSTGDGG